MQPSERGMVGPVKLRSAMQRTTKRMSAATKDDVTRPDRRRFPRHAAGLPLKLRDSSRRDIDGFCVVISQSGLAGILPEAIPVGVTVELRFVLPGQPTVVVARAVVRVCREINYGFEFVSLPEAARKPIEHFCERDL